MKFFIPTGAYMFIAGSFMGAARSFPHEDSFAGQINLGYAKHVPTYVNTTLSGRRVAIYKNIRFANSPTGELRFRKPDTNLPVESGVQNGSAPVSYYDCISSAPSYIPSAYLPGPGFNGTTWGREDCLFLDVYVPENVKPGDKVPVLHYFVGSAYAFGSKDSFAYPMGLFNAMKDNEKLGMPGWTYSTGQDMDANAGLFDCLEAVNWTSKYIHKFGGDGRRITAAGESAGAGILYTISTLNGGQGYLPYQQASMSSPAAQPRRNVTGRLAQLFDTVLQSTNCTSLACLRAVPETTMISANDQLINHMAATGGGGNLGPVIGFGPVPDGKEFPDVPLALLQQGKFHKDLKRVVLGTMAFEGMGLSSDEDMPAMFPTIVRLLLPTASNSTVAALQANYHPYISPAQLAWDWVTDIIFACNAYNLARAMPGRAYRYIMSIPPAVHGQDVTYFFYNNNETTPVASVEDAESYQQHLLSFVQGNDCDWPVYGGQQELFNITTSGFEITRLPSDLQYRCDTINKAILDPANGA